MVRERFRAPLHSAGQAVGDHSPQSAKRQSTSLASAGGHAIKELHFWYSSRSPSSGLPQSFASTFSSRERHCIPPSPQVTLHDPHSDQRPHSPSTHSWPEQCPGHDGEDTTSSIGKGSQSLPLPVGTVVMTRLRFLKPMPQNSAFWHSPHSCQELHLQSWSLWQTTSLPYRSRTTQPRTALSPTLHPTAPAAAVCTTLRSRICCPWPHVASQVDHCDHTETAQSSTASQGISLQGSDSAR
mmetsp:Transcript_49614/g.106239  ORF Transcript_49614/g.106239 Transcript_49614/m.106239 type:complete len:240 (+) Transcript_49614:935-1654(+)